jgi:hypothetical protein
MRMLCGGPALLLDPPALVPRPSDFDRLVYVLAWKG